MANGFCIPDIIKYSPFSPSYAEVSEEYENTYIIKSQHKGKFTEWHFAKEQSDLIGGEAGRQIMATQNFNYGDEDPISTLEKLKKQKPQEFLELVNEGRLFPIEMLTYHTRVVYKNIPDSELKAFIKRLFDLESPC